MRIFTIIFCLFLSVNALGQSKNVPNKPVAIIVVDGVITEKSELYKINPNDVANISVLKGTAATKLYGKKAAGGALIVTTKKKQNPVLNFLRLERALTETAPSARPLVVLKAILVRSIQIKLRVLNSCKVQQPR